MHAGESKCNMKFILLQSCTRQHIACIYYMQAGDYKYSNNGNGSISLVIGG
jgi:hypothetical protein